MRLLPLNEMTPALLGARPGLRVQSSREYTEKTEAEVILAILQSAVAQG